MSYADELDLIQRCADGEDAAWSELLRDYGRFLDYIVRRSLSGGGRVADPNQVSEVRDEILAIFPELNEDADSFGPSARQSLRAYEARAFKL